MYEPMLDCRRIVETGGHDGGLVRCDMERCRLSPQERGADPKSLAVHLRRRASKLAQRSRHHINPHCLLRTRPERGRPIDLKLQCHSTDPSETYYFIMLFSLFIMTEK